jgi:hypothetical protein
MQNCPVTAPEKGFAKWRLKLANWRMNAEYQCGVLRLRKSWPEMLVHLIATAQATKTL